MSWGTWVSVLTPGRLASSHLQSVLASGHLRFVLASSRLSSSQLHDSRVQVCVRGDTDYHLPPDVSQRLLCHGARGSQGRQRDLALDQGAAPEQVCSAIFSASSLLSGLELSNTKVYGPSSRALLRTASHSISRHLPRVQCIRANRFVAPGISTLSKGSKGRQRDLALDQGAALEQVCSYMKRE